LRYGAFFQNNLIAVVCFASITRQESADRLSLHQDYIRELVRLCSHPGFYNSNLLSWFLTRAVRLLKERRPETKCVITFADETFGHTGAIYKACGWDFDGTVQKSYWYVDQDGYVMHKKTLYNHARKMGLKEMQYAKENNYHRVWGKRKLRFIKWL